MDVSTAGLTGRAINSEGAHVNPDVSVVEVLKESKSSENYFPAANIGRLIKKVIPPNARVSKEAIADIQEKVYEFISFISSEAGVHCSSAKRRTVKGEDIISALNDLGFDNYGEVLSTYLSKFKETMDEPKPSKKAKAEKGEAQAAVASELIKSEPESKSSSSSVEKFSDTADESL